MINEFDCYLFDADGTLFDTTDLICHCFINTAKFTGKTDLDKASVLRYIGMTLRDQMNIHFGPLTDERFAELRLLHMDYQLSVYKNYLKPCPGVLEALTILKARGKKSVVVTSRMRHSLDIYLKDTGLYSYFDHYITPETTKNHKPHPEPALKALELLNATPDQSIFIGDSTFDIECGHAAGTKTAFVNWSINEITSLNVKPTYCLDNMRDLINW
jgi:pyrophosphatase PpaX